MVMLKYLKIVLLSAALVFAGNSYAVRTENNMHKKCTMQDAWKGPDKTKHVIAGAGVGAGATLVFKEPEYGVLATVVVAGLKEVYDRRGYGTCSFQDFAVTVAAGVAASYAVNWVIVPVDSGVIVMYNKKF